MNISEEDKNGKITNFALYALNDPEGLKRVLDGRLKYREE